MPEAPKNDSQRVDEVNQRVLALEADLKILAQHIRDSMQVITTYASAMTELGKRLAAVENKTSTLPKMPDRQNCPHCGKIIMNPTAVRCPTCNKALPQRQR